MRVCQIYIPPTLVAAVADEAELPRHAGLALREDRIFAADRELRAMAEQYLRRALDARTPACPLEMDARALLIALRLAQSHSNLDAPPPPPPQRGALAPERLRRVADFMEAHLAEPLTLDALAAVAGLSRHHFATAFRRATGLPLHRFLHARRVERAKALIAAGQPLAELALDCGFALQQHLTSAFRRTVGVTPAVWRAGAAPAAARASLRAEGAGEAD